jgi:hypothetical protein
MSGIDQNPEGRTPKNIPANIPASRDKANNIFFRVTISLCKGPGKWAGYRDDSFVKNQYAFFLPLPKISIGDRMKTL